jgi:transcriptional regulator with XRE-family HTH domain
MNQVGCQDGGRIRRLREDLRLSGSELARRVGVKPQTLSNIELGNKPAGIGTLLKIARELGVPVDELVLAGATEGQVTVPAAQGAVL